MKNIPICPICNQNYPSTDEGCIHCKQKTIKEQIAIKQRIMDIKANETSNIDLISKKNIPKVTPPPIPRKADHTTKELMRNIEINITKVSPVPQTSKKTIIFRRGIMIVFEETSFELFLQQPWIKKILGNELQISFERKFTSENGPDHIIVTLLRLRIIHAKTNNESLHDFLLEKTVNDEMAFRINEAFVVVKDSPLTDEWHKFLIGKSNSKFVYYLSRNELNNSHYENFSLMESEALFISLIKRLLVIKEQVDIKILDNKQKVRIKDRPKVELPVIYKASDLSVSDSVTYCMAHGGAVNEFYTCSVCGGSLCSICLGSFLICPGSISTDLHKFIKLDS